MSRFVKEADRGQWTLLPECLDDFIDESLTKTLPKVAAEMALSVLAYNLTRAMNIVGIKPLIAAIVA